MLVFPKYPKESVLNLIVSWLYGANSVRYYITVNEQLFKNSQKKLFSMFPL